MSNITLPLFEILDDALSVPIFFEGNVTEAPCVVIEFDETNGTRTLDEYLWEENIVDLRVHTLHETDEVNQEDAEAIKEGVRGVLEPRVSVNQISQYVPPPTIRNAQYDHEDQTAYDIILTYEFKNSTLLASVESGGSEVDCSLEQDLTVTNINVGAINNGTLFKEGTKLEQLWRALLIEATKATINLNKTGNTNVEIGTTVNTDLTSTFTQNQSGPLIEHFIDGQSFNFDNPAQTSKSFTMGNATDITTQKQFTSEAQYDSSPDFPSGSVSDGVTFNGRRFVYRGHSNSEPTTASEVTSLSGESPILNAQNGLTFNINVPDGATSVEFAYPAALGNVSLIEFQGAITKDDTDNYQQTTVSGVGQSGYEIDYFVYRQSPADPYSNVNIEVVI